MGCVIASAVTLLPGILVMPYDSLTNAEDEVGEIDTCAVDSPSTIAEARSRARLLHETIHATLQVVHRDYFREDERLLIPSQSMEDVFVELARLHKVKLKWLVVNADAMNVDHKPQNEFERNAVKALSTGKKEFEFTQRDTYQFAGTIRLSAQCLKCHVATRTNLKDRVAGLVITMPLKIQN